MSDKNGASRQKTATEDSLSLLIDTTPAFIHTALPDGALDFLNHGWLEFVGLTLPDLLGWRWTSVIHPEDVEEFVDKWRASITSGDPFVAESRVRRADGEYRWFLHRKVALRDEAGKIVKWYGSSLEIEDRKHAEEELRASERKYRDLVDTTPAFIHTALPDGSLDFLSRGWLEYGGLALTDLKEWRWTAAIHPEDVEGFVDKWRSALVTGEPFEAESRVRRADGEYRWFLQRNVPLRDETGKIVKWYGTGIDIEERKTAEDKIRAQETELRQVLNLTPQHIAVSGPDGSPLYANHAALEYFGITLDQWRASSRIDFVHPDDREHLLGKRENRFLEAHRMSWKPAS